MNVSYNWLKQYIDHNLTPEELATVLTGIGLEVESMEPAGDSIKLDCFVTGKVLTCAKHPDADKLTVTTVDAGQEKPLEIVCGAPNVKAGQNVIVALPGATVKAGNSTFVIKKTKIRGAVSEGMICAEDELGIGESHEGILVLPEGITPGMPAESYFNTEPDFTITIGLTPNRIDSASHYGVARDLAAFLTRDGKKTSFTGPDVSAFREGEGKNFTAVDIENTESCRRYAGVNVTGVKTGASPEWMQKRLKAIGLNPINNVVDITNYVLYELGQPLHAFDADTIGGNRIVVKNMPEGTKFITLDGNEHTLSADDLMICDAIKPVAIAGVFGGLHSGVTDETVNVFIESAYFDPVSVRRTSKRLGIYTDASFRFERGVDPDMTIYALKRCALLLQEIAGGTIASPVIDVYPKKIGPKNVRLTYANTNRLIGKTLEKGTIKSILQSLEFTITGEDDKGIDILVPPYRVDVYRESDVIEEILRIYGYNNIEVSERVNASISSTAKPDEEDLVNVVSDYLCSNGFYEIMCNSLTGAAKYDKLTLFSPEKLVRIMNPLSNDLNVMRQTLIFGGLETIIYNTNRQRPDLKLFEFGKIYQALKGNPDLLDSYNEEWRLSMLATGKITGPGWFSDNDSSNFFQLKGYLESIMSVLGLDLENAESEIINEKDELFSAGIRYRINGTHVADLALIDPVILRDYDIRNSVCYAEVIWNNIPGLLKGRKIVNKELPRYPEVRRDLSLLLDRSVTYSMIRELAGRTEKKYLKKIRLFDVYEGDKIEKGKKSYAVSFMLQDNEKTLTDERIDAIVKKIIKVFTAELGAVIR